MQDTSARGWAECHGATIGWRVQLKPERMGYRIGNENLEGGRRSATFDTRAWTSVQQDDGRRTNDRNAFLRHGSTWAISGPSHRHPKLPIQFHAAQNPQIPNAIPPSRLFSAHTPFPWIPDPEPLGPENSSRANQGKTAEQRGKAAVQALRLGVGTREVRRCERKQTRLTKPRVPEQQTISRNSNWENGPPGTQDVGRGTWDAEVRRRSKAKQSRAEQRAEESIDLSYFLSWRPGDLDRPCSRSF
ncbi:hypothetical protein CNYM01_07238 [Colletotrichum nymphaeae SA-01]|uniref:Uncharacterized protein n=1 Tax=Colletotrichum nymphaeae SA-01 TaxID=1460502 RepID=A0A135SUG3_9PEZI|nr:hypothetical protein CNYM01_07238 [Colletotrichum nymphaeae SA-01]